MRLTKAVVWLGGRSILVSGVVALLLSACPASKRTDRKELPKLEPMPSASRSAVPAGSSDASPQRPAAPSRADADNGPASEITAPCVLHAGDSRHHHREILKPKGKPGGVVELAECSFSAECIWVQGKASPGDGNVGVECSGRQCTCRQTILARPATPIIFTFAIDTPCSTTEEAQRLLVEHCMKGMKVERP